MLAEPFDVKALNAGVARLLDDAALRTKLGTAARTWVRRECNTRSVLDQIRNVYESVTGTAARRNAL